MILVSVCMPTYNQECFIEKAIKGVLMQKDCHLELIIANDCSTDSTQEICNRYQQIYPSTIKIINQEHNKGVVENTKDGLLACKGKYIAICEGDDYWIDEYKLKNQIDCLESNNNVSLVHTNWINYFQDSNEFIERKMIFKNEYISEKECGNISVLTILNNEYRGIRFSSICFRRESLLKASNRGIDIFKPEFPTVDLSIFLYLAHEGLLLYLPQSTTVYRIQSESVSISSDTSKRIKFAMGCERINIYYIKTFEIQPPKEMKTKIISHMLNINYIRYNSEFLREILSFARFMNYKMNTRQFLSILFQKLRYTLINK